MKNLWKATVLLLILTAALTCVIACDDTDASADTATEAPSSVGDWVWPLGDETIILPEDVFED